MKLRFLFFSGVGVLVLFGLTYGGWRLYQNHLSTDLRSTLIAATDPTASDADIHAYLRRARLQIRTERDVEIFGKITTAVQLKRMMRKQALINAQELGDFATHDLDENSPCRQMLRLGATKLASTRAQTLREQCEGQQAAEKAELKSSKAKQAIYQKEMDQERALLRDVRNELGLPVIEDK